MIPRLNRGAGNLDAILIIAFLVFVMIATHGDSGKSNGGFLSGTTLGSDFSSGSKSIQRTTTIGSSKINISSGNAAYEYQPYKEYITVENWGNTPIDITGWTLRNGKDKRTYDIGGQLQRFSADIASIPQATALLSPSGGSAMLDVVLERGDRAIITTGSPGPRSPYTIVSFKENTCTGYLEKLPDYSFDPALELSCPRPSTEPGLDGLDTACRLFIDTLSSCTTPHFDTKDRNGETCETCLNGKRLSSPCATYIKKHFSYQGCIAYHAGDANFTSNRTWRIFLGRGWEMWAKNYESIELFDRFNNLMSTQNY